MAHKHEVISKPFSDVHNKGGHILATLLHDPTVEGLDVALYMDGSASMEDEYGPRGILAKLGPVKNQVEPQMRWMLEYLANKDRDSVLRVAYWATGDGSQIEVVGDLTGAQAQTYKFPGPQFYGKGTVMLPVLRDYVAYIRKQAEAGARRGLAVIITDSQLYDANDVRAYSEQVAKEISSGRLPRLNFVLVGVGGRFALGGDIGLFGRVLGVQLKPLFKPAFGIGQDRFGRTLRFANPAIDAFAGVDDEHVLALVEAIDRADLDAVRVLALDAGVGNDIGHGNVSPENWLSASSAMGLGAGSSSVR